MTRKDPSFDEPSFDHLNAPDAGVHHPWFVLSSGSMHPDVYFARRRRARRAAVIGTVVVASGIAVGAWGLRSADVSRTLSSVGSALSSVSSALSSVGAALSSFGSEVTRRVSVEAPPVASPPP